ncbi:unnamed protein product [Moneuplotes crassus]|uniref:Uncharacterized protein n=1 Tax=Euplotes crassus TaxID=5936 RepID=A0AAD2CZN2_EUPCR|nr:unnamed protein product [Moneuplotes crassus]
MSFYNTKCNISQPSNTRVALQPFGVSTLPIQAGNLLGLNYLSQNLDTKNYTEESIKPKLAFENFCMGIENCCGSQSYATLRKNLGPPNALNEGYTAGFNWLPTPTKHFNYTVLNENQEISHLIYQDVTKDSPSSVFPSVAFNFRDPNIFKYSNQRNSNLPPKHASCFPISCNGQQAEGFRPVLRGNTPQTSTTPLPEVSRSPIGQKKYDHNLVLPKTKKLDSSIDKKLKEITNCGHTMRKHYAKGMCSTCYHKRGRTKKAWNCEHTDELHYAKGCCQECYLIFHSKRGKNKLKKILNEKKRKQKEESLSSEAAPSV